MQRESLCELNAARKGTPAAPYIAPAPVSRASVCIRIAQRESHRRLFFASWLSRDSAVLGAPDGTGRRCCQTDDLNGEERCGDQLYPQWKVCSCGSGSCAHCPHLERARHATGGGSWRDRDRLALLHPQENTRACRVRSSTTRCCGRGSIRRPARHYECPALKRGDGSHVHEVRAASHCAREPTA